MAANDDESRLPKEQNSNKRASPADSELGGGEDPAKRTLRIRALNDELRSYGLGGMVMISAGLRALGPDITRIVLQAVKAFDEFGPDNDPWGEHDCASVETFGVQALWKIDCYERSGRIHSPDPADPRVTLRVI